MGEMSKGLAVQEGLGGNRVGGVSDKEVWEMATTMGPNGSRAERHAHSP